MKQVSYGNALKAAAARGVAVNLLLDGFGSQRNWPMTLLMIWQQKWMCTWCFIDPKSHLWTLQKRRLIRMHRKRECWLTAPLVLSARINILNDSGRCLIETPPRVDYAVQLKGQYWLIWWRACKRCGRHMSWMARLKKISNSVSKKSC